MGYQLIRNATGEAWPKRLVPEVPTSQWKFSFIPDFPSGIPILFTYGTCEIGTGCSGCPPCKPRSSYFFGQDWLEWISQRGDGDKLSKAVPIDGAGHWTNCLASKATNAAISSWLHSIS